MHRGWNPRAGDFLRQSSRQVAAWGRWRLSAPVVTVARFELPLCYHRPPMGKGPTIEPALRARSRVLATCLGVLFLWTATSGCQRSAREPEPTPVVLVTIDTLRADHLGSYGYPRGVTPFLDRLATQGRRYANAIASGSHTAPSHASIFTSRQPFQHGVVKNGQRLPAQERPVAELLAGLGWETAGFASVGFLNELDQGFGTFDAAWRSGDKTVDLALDWWAVRTAGPEAGQQPFFLWIHLYDPHSGKGPRPAIEPDRAALEARRADEGEELVSLLEQRGLDPAVFESTERLLDRYDLYDAGIRFADRQVERLYQTITAAAPRTRWIITSDHGEGMGNHGYVDHGKYLYREQLHVPLILAGPGVTPGSDPELVRLVDLYPTILDWAGVAPAERPTSLEGRSLAADGGPGALPPRLAFAQRRPKDGARHRQSWVDGEVYSLETARYKLIHGTHASPEFYDREVDPWELDNRAGEGDAMEGQLRDWLLTYVASADPTTPEEADAPTEHDDELRALGYL